MSPAWAGAARGALRPLRRRPGAALAATALAAVGTASFLAVFAVVDAVRYRSLPVYQPSRLARLAWDTAAPPPQWLVGPSPGFTGSGVPLFVFRALQQKCSRCMGVFGTAPLGIGPMRVQAQYDGRRDGVEGEAVVGDYFSGLGIAPALGRFLPGADSRREVVVSHRLWATLLGADSRALGQTIFLDGGPYVVAGVAPPGFEGTILGRRAAFWVRARNWGPVWGLSAKPTAWWVVTFARARPGSSVRQTERQMATIAAATLRGFAGSHGAGPGMPRFRGVPAARGLDVLANALGAYMPLLVAAGAAGTLMAWSGLAFLALWASIADGLDYALRRSLGAGAGDIVLRAVLVAAPPAIAGAAAGAWAGMIASRLLAARLAASLAHAGLAPPAAVLDLRGISVVLALLAGAVVAGGVVPGITVARRREWLGLVGGRPEPLAAAPVPAAVAPIAVGFALLLASATLVASASTLVRAPVGFQPRRLLLADVRAPQPAAVSRMPSLASQQRFAARYESLLRRVARVRGVTHASLATITPFAGWDMPMPILAAGARVPVMAPINLAASSYFAAMGIPIVAGRAFGLADVALGRGVAVVSQALAAKLAPRGGILGMSLSMFGRPMRVVGVCADVRFESPLRSRPRARIYMPFSFWAGLAQHSPEGMVLAVRTQGPSEAVARQLSRFRWRGFRLSHIRTGGEQLRAAVPGEMMMARVGAVTGAAAFVLLALVVYGFLAQVLAVRRRDMAVRLALGCPAGRLARSLAGQIGRLLLVGLGAGAVLAWWAGTWLRAWLHGVAPLDARVLFPAAVAVVVAAAAALALGLRAACRGDLVRLMRE